MRILFDNGTPEPLIPFLKNHTVTTAKQVRWAAIDDGDLLDFAEMAGYEVLVTAEKRMRDEQNWTGRRIAVVVPGNLKWEIAQRSVRRIAAAVDRCEPGDYIEVDIPRW
jgi:hypothetical protein